MENTPEAALKDIAFSFQRNGKQHSSAMVYAEVAKHLQNEAAVYTGLGAALAKAAPGAERITFITWAAKSLKRGLLIGQGGPFESPCVNWLEIIKEEIDVVEPDPMVVEELDSLIAYLQGVASTLVTDTDALEEEDQKNAVYAMVNMPCPMFLPVALAGAGGQFGEEVQRKCISALPGFGDQAQVRELLAEVALRTDSDALQPELKETMVALDADWAGQFDTQS